MKQRDEQRQEMLGEQLGAFRSRVDAIVLDGAGNGVDAGIEFGQQGHVILCRNQPVGLIKLTNVVGAVIGRKGDAGEEDLAAGVDQSGDDGVEVAACGVDGDAAEPVVAAEFDNSHGRVEAEDVFQAVDSVFAGIAADAGVDNPVVIAASIEERLQVGRVRERGIDAMAGGDAVAEASDDGLGMRRGNGMMLRGVERQREDEGGGEGRKAAQHSLSLAMRELVLWRVSILHRQKVQRRASRESG